MFPDARYGRIARLVPRLVAWAGLLLVCAAVALGKWSGARLDRSATTIRTLAGDRPVWINPILVGTRVKSRFFDVESTHRGDVALPSAERLIAAACSPWRDERGRRQVVGIYLAHSDDAAKRGRTLTIVRLTHPDGAVLDAFVPETFPSGPPCWYPGDPARVLFTATDGRLFEWRFDEPGGGLASLLPRVRPLVWRGHGDADGRELLGDLCLPTDPRLKDRAFVALKSDVGAAKHKLSTLLWWLRLSENSPAIVRDGPLRPTGSEDPRVAERYPQVQKNDDGALLLAYLREELGKDTWQLHITPLVIDARTGDPAIVPSGDWIVAERCLPIPPVFSSDGKWVIGLLRDDPEPRAVRRFAVARKALAMD